MYFIFDRLVLGMGGNETYGNPLQMQYFRNGSPGSWLDNALQNSEMSIPGTKGYDLPSGIVYNK